MKARFVGPRPSLGYQPGQVYRLDVRTDWRGRPTIHKPYPCPYTSWDTFWANWEKVREVAG